MVVRFSFRECDSLNQSLVSTFESWLKEKGFSNLDEAVTFQEKAVGRDRYKLVDLAVQHVKEVGGTYHSMISRYSSVRAFFLHRRVELPRVQVIFSPTRDAVVGKFTLPAFKLLVDESGLREKAIYLTLFQGMMDQQRFFGSFNPRGYELGVHIKDKGVDEPCRVDFLRGRKANPHPFNSFIGREALSAWKTYFECEREWPKEGEPAALDQTGKALTKDAFSHQHLRRIKRLKFAKGKSCKTIRYGYNLHELRDLGRSVLEKAKEDGFNTLSAEFWMGHTVDPYFYNKVWSLDREYNLTQYRIAEKYLSILSKPVQIVQTLKPKEIVAELFRNREAMDLLIEGLNRRNVGLRKIEESPR